MSDYQLLVFPFWSYGTNVFSEISKPGIRVCLAFAMLI